MAHVVPAAGLVLGVSFLTLAAPQAAPRPLLVVRVLDYATTSSVTLIEAEHHVMQVFGTAGIDVAWREQKAPPPANAHQEVAVVILSEVMAERKLATQHIARGVLATAAPPPANRAWVFMSRVEDEASRQHRSSGLVLGHVIAHEVAHMIAHVGHSENGLMASMLRLGHEDVQGFSSAQARQLRSAIVAGAGVVLLDARVGAESSRANLIPPR